MLVWYDKATCNIAFLSTQQFNVCSKEAIRSDPVECLMS